MTARTRWIYALLGSALLMVLTIVFLYLASQFANKLMYDACLERDGRWDYTERRCYLPSRPKES